MDDPATLTDSDLLAAFYALPLTDGDEHDAYGEAVISELKRRELDF